MQEAGTTPAADLLAVLLAGVQDPLVVVDAVSARILWASAGVGSLLGYRDNAPPESIVDLLVDVPDRRAWWAWVEALPGRSGRSDCLLRHRDGNAVMVAQSARTVRHGDRSYVVLNCQDLTMRLAAAAVERARETLVGTVLATMSEAVLVVDAAGVIVHANPQSAAVLTVPPAESIGMSLVAAARAVLDEDGVDIPLDARPSTRVLHSGEPVYGVVVGLLPEPRPGSGVGLQPEPRAGSGVGLLPETSPHEQLTTQRVRWHVVNAAPLPTTGGVVLTFTEVTTLKAQEYRLQRMAWFDGLTGLPNRARLAQRLAATAGVLAILYLDLDGFKEVNDVFGHTLGDRLLVAVATRLRASIAPTDFVARFGGDEFVVVLAGPTRAAATERARRLAADLCRIVSTPYVVADHELVISVSIGITLSDGGPAGSGSGDPDAPDADAETWLQQADMALYAAKNAGRDTFRFFTSMMDVRMQLGARTAAAIRTGLSAEEFTVHLQPIARTTPGARPHAAECLLRWPRPGGAMPPDQFIPIAEDSGLIRTLGSWVFDEALRIWPTVQHLHPDGLMLAVNLSGRQLRWPGVAEELAASLCRTGCDPALLAVEVTESSILGDVQDTIDRLAALKDLGVRVAIDDFGTGYSSLAHLLELPVDVIKIDRSFVSGVVEDQVSGAIVTAVIDMARGMGLQVVAEGVETPGQLTFLRDRGCHSYQGFLLGAPLAVPDFLTRWGPGSQRP